MKKWIALLCVLTLLLSMFSISLAAEADLATPEEGASLVYWSMWNETEPQGQVIAQAIEAFVAETGIPVEVNWNGRNIRQTLEPALAGGEVIDIFDEDVRRMLNNWGQYTLGLDAYVNAAYDGVVYRDTVNHSLISLAEQLGEAKGFEDGNKLHNIPYQPSAFVVMYNKALFEKAGITAVPTTWEEFTAACESLKAIGVAGITVDDAYIADLLGYTMDRIAGSEAVIDMVSNVDFSHPCVLKAGELWEEMARNGWISANAASNVYPAAQISEIAQETAAMYLNGTWLPNEIKSSAPDIQWGAFAFPAIDAEGDGTEANYYGGQSFGINKDTLYPNACFALVRWLTTGEWDQALADASMGVPMANNATWPVELADAKAVIDSTTKWIPMAVTLRDNTEINAAVKAAFQKLIRGDYTAQQFADDLAGLTASN